MVEQARNIAVLSWTDIKKKYPVEKFIHVLAAEDSVFAHGAPQWRLDVTVVGFDPTDEKACYPIEKTKKEQVNGRWVGGDIVSVGLTKASLEKLAAAADVSIVPLKKTVNPMFAEFEFMGVLSSKGGTIRTQPASKTWNGELRQEVKQQEAEDRFLRALEWNNDVKIPGVGWKSAKNCSTEERAAAIEGVFRVEWLREREFGPATAETKAMNRARRAILGLSAKYSFEEIRDKEFIVPRWVFEPDMNNPAIAHLVITAGLQAQQRAFLMPAPEPAPDPALLIPAGTPVETVSLLPDQAEKEAEAAEDASSGLVNTPQGPTDLETGEVFPEGDRAAPAEPKEDDRPIVQEEPDDISLIANEELSFYVAQNIGNYIEPEGGPTLQRIKKRWRVCSQSENPDFFSELRQILRVVLANQKKPEATS